MARQSVLHATDAPEPPDFADDASVAEFISHAATPHERTERAKDDAGEQDLAAGDVNML